MSVSVARRCATEVVCEVDCLSMEEERRVCFRAALLEESFEKNSECNKRRTVFTGREYLMTHSPVVYVCQCAANSIKPAHELPRLNHGLISATIASHGAGYGWRLPHLALQFQISDSLLFSLSVHNRPLREHVCRNAVQLGREHKRLVVLPPTG